MKHDRRNKLTDKVTVIGAGLAGSEAAFQLAELGIPVELVEMRPLSRHRRTIPAILLNLSAAIRFARLP